MEDKTMRKIMMAVAFTAACGSMTPPAGNNGSDDTGSDSGSGSDGSGSDGSGSGSGSGSGNLGMACSAAVDCGPGGACDLGQHVCVAPAFTLDRMGFVDDGTRWWTGKSNPSLAGAIASPSGVSLEAYIGTSKIGTAVVNGSAWSLQLPASSIAETDTRVMLRLVSATTTIEEAQLFALDDKAPTATLIGSVRDERGDQIDFSTGEAVHTHAGAAIDLGGTGCPAVYKYAYLEDQTAPTFGREAAPNPLAWQITVADSTNIDSMDSAYRVRDASNHVLYDWTSISPDASGVYAVTLYRNKIRALGTQTGHMFVDVRFRDGFGNEATTSKCFDNHPMAPPLQIGAFTKGDMFGWSLLADSPISLLMGYLYAAPVSTQTITQYAGEPVVIELATPAFNVSYTLAAVDDIVASSVAPASYFCSNSGANCITTPPADPADSTSSGTIPSSRFGISIVDSANVLCSTTGASITCTIPARATNQGPTQYTVSYHVNNLTELQPFPGSATAVYGEYAVLGLTYSGQQPTTVATQCSSVSGPAGAGGKCIETTTYTEIRAADHITLHFPALVRTVTTSVDQGAHWEPISYATGSMSIPATTWDSGNDDLPGPQ